MLEANDKKAPTTAFMATVMALTLTAFIALGFSRPADESQKQKQKNTVLWTAEGIKWKDLPNNGGNMAARKWSGINKVEYEVPLKFSGRSQSAMSTRAAPVLLAEFIGGGGFGGSDFAFTDFTSISFGLVYGFTGVFPFEACLGCELSIPIGTTGVYDFNASSPQWAEVIARLTDGTDELLMSMFFLSGTTIPPNYGAGGGNPESGWLNGEPDLIGTQIDFIRLIVHRNDIGPSCCAGGGGFEVSTLVTWQFWGVGEPLPNTPVGEEVGVQPTTATGTIPVGINFSTVTQTGTTSVTVNNSGPEPPAGFSLGDPPTYYELATTALFDGPIRVCIDYSDAGFGDESALRLFYLENGIWVDRTVSLNTYADRICATVASFSLFAIFERSESREVTIDIKPGTYPNSINLKNNGVIPVAVLTTATFNAATADPLLAKFGPNGATEAHNTGHIQDVDSDGDLDLVLHFKTQEAGIQCGQTQAGLTGQTFGGQTITGTDAVQTAGCAAKLAAEKEVGVPEEYTLEQNYPNPFNPETEIHFQLPEVSHVAVKIFNTLGVEIRTLVDEQRETGYHRVQWDGKDKNGKAVASGVYFYQLCAGSFSQVKKMSLLR